MAQFKCPVILILRVAAGLPLLLGLRALGGADRDMNSEIGIHKGSDSGMAFLGLLVLWLSSRVTWGRVPTQGAVLVRPDVAPLLSDSVVDDIYVPRHNHLMIAR